MPPRFDQAKFNAAVRQSCTTSDDLKLYGQRLEAVGRELDRENRWAQSRLRQLPRSQPQVSTLERTFLDSVTRHVAADPLVSTTCSYAMPRSI